MKPGPSINELSLQVLYWNINGRWRFLNDEYYFSWLKQFHIVFITETHFTKGQKFDLSDYQSYHNPFSDINSRKPCSGISVFVHDSIQDYIDDVDHQNYSNHIVITLKGGHRISGSYIPPSDSIYYSEEYIWSIPSFFTPKDSDKIFLGGGDFNSRLGDIADHDPWKYRKNPDTETNSNGRMLKKICRKYNLLTLNNLTVGDNDFDGDFTYNKDNRKSQVDLCIGNEQAVHATTSFQIHKMQNNFSDHLPISASLTLNMSSTISSGQILHDILWDNDLNSRRPKKLPTNINWDAYVNTASIELQKLNQELENVSEHTQSSVDRIIDTLNETISKTARSCEIKPNEESHTEASLDENRSIDQISADISRKEIESWNALIENNNPIEFWKKINWKDDKAHENLRYPSAEALGEHFQEKSNIKDEIPFSFNDEGTYVPELDDPISTEELDKASKRLKEKATADGWSPRLVTSLSSVIFTILTILMNVILQKAIYPSLWRITIVCAIFKNKGSSLLAKFYRPISLVQLLSKFFDFVLLDRFMKWFKPHDCQTAYQDEKTSADHVFLLRSLIHCNYLVSEERFFCA